MLKLNFQNFAKFILNLIHDDKLVRRLGFYLSIAAILSGIATYVVLTTSGTFSDKSNRLLPLIYLDLTLLLLLAAIIVKRLVELWSEHRRGQAGSRLHVQIVGLFSFVAVTPAICVAIFAALFFNVGIQTWFSEPVRSALDEAHVVSEAYLDDHIKSIKHDALIIVGHLGPQINILTLNPDILTDILSEFSEDRNLSELMVIKGTGQIIARSNFTFAIEFEKIFRKYLEQVQDEKYVIMTNENRDRVRAIIKIDSATDTYLYIGKIIDQSILKHVQQTQGAITAYNKLDEQRSKIHITFVLFFMVIALLLLLSAIWAGLTVANIFVMPISRLIVAADQVSRGDLTVQVSAEGTIINNELGHLGEAFNKMTAQLHHQHQSLMKANKKIDHRRQFMETILARVSAGVISMNHSGEIFLINQRACDLLSPQKPPHKGDFLQDICAELFHLLPTNAIMPHDIISQQITIVRHGMSQILQASIAVDASTQKSRSYILTFDDITPLMMAQRKAAWSDVARRIAHEVKNPLTPIQLSAERLKRRYLSEITSDPVTFQHCIDTIIRQVGNIGKLIGEFSSFARMPEPVIQPEDLGEICRQAVFLQRQAHSAMNISFNNAEASIIIDCDAGQMGQVFTNLLQNSINAIEQYTPHQPAGYQPTIVVSLTITDSTAHVVVEDNGPGFPSERRERLTEPYFTTHAKGTGLGLAIVAKIVEDHRGRLELGDSPLGGAKVVLNFSLASKR